MTIDVKKKVSNNLCLLTSYKISSKCDATAGNESSFLEEVHNLGWSGMKGKTLESIPDWKICNEGVPHHKKILSIGSGTGQDIAFLTEHNEIYAFDISPKAMEIAGELGIRTKLWDVSKGVHFPDGFFDIIICKDVLEHVLDPVYVLKEIHRTLKSDGYAVVNVPNHFYFILRWRLLLGKGLIWKTLHHDHTRCFDEWNYMHIRFFTYKGFKRLLRHCGFTDIRFFWDLGPFLHYSNPDIVIPNAKRKLREGQIPSLRRRILVRAILPVLGLFSVAFPRRIRACLTRLSPGLLSACFYVHCRKS